MCKLVSQDFVKYDCKMASSSSPSPPQIVVVIIIKSSVSSVFTVDLLQRICAVNCSPLFSRELSCYGNNSVLSNLCGVIFKCLYSSGLTTSDNNRALRKYLNICIVSVEGKKFMTTTTTTTQIGDSVFVVVFLPSLLCMFTL